MAIALKNGRGERNAQKGCGRPVVGFRPDSHGELPKLTQNKIDYFVVCVNDFADTHGMSYVAAFDYLKAHKGIDFLSTHYDIEHTYSIEDAVADLAQVCSRNGGVAA